MHFLLEAEHLYLPLRLENCSTLFRWFIHLNSLSISLDRVSQVFIVNLLGKCPAQPHICELISPDSRKFAEEKRHNWHKLFISDPEELTLQAVRKHAQIQRLTLFYKLI